MAKVWKRKDRDVWIADYRDAIGKRRRLTAPTREKAEKKLAEKINESRKALPLHRNEYDITLREYAETWLEVSHGEIEPKTIRSYRQNLNLHILPVLGHMKVREIRRVDIVKLLRTISQTRHGQGVTKKRYTKNSLRIIKATLSSLLTDALDEGIIQSNPALQLNQRKKRQQLSQGREKDPNPMSWSQRDQFLRGAMELERVGRLPYRHRILWTLRAKTGIRPEEAYGLQIGDIDFIKRSVRIERAISLGKVKLTKTEERREVDLSESLVGLLQEYISYVEAEALANGWPPPYWLFPNRQGGIKQESDERWDRKLFKRVLRHAGLPDFVPYDLRHTYASLLLSENAPLLYVSEQLGHAKPMTTLKHYSRWMPKEERRFVNILDGPTEDVGTKSWHQSGGTEETESQVIEKIGGPYRDRTCGPLIKSQLLYQLS